VGEVTRSGFVALAGRPNVGKSTLVNALVGQKVAIVSDKPQTTRRAIRGVATKPDEWQLVLTDLPGVQRPRDVLTERMQKRVEHELAESDAAMLVLNGEQGVGGPGDRFIAEALRGANVPVVIAVNKVDRLDRTRTVAALAAAADLGLDGEVFPISPPRARSCSRSTTSPTSRSTSALPSSCASRCSTAPARRSRTRSRSRSTR
jgi:GTP-binding protein Era